MAKATWLAVTLADSAQTEQVEGNHYFPADSIRRQFFESSAHTTVCPWKGTAHYYHVVVNGKRNENAAWFYPQPEQRSREHQGSRSVLEGRKGRGVDSKRLPGASAARLSVLQHRVISLKCQLSLRSF